MKTQWRVIKKEEWKKLYQDGAHYFSSVADDNGRIICQCADKESLKLTQDTADLIARAHNIHNELLEACKKVLKMLPPMTYTPSAQSILQQAITKAEAAQ